MNFNHLFYFYMVAKHQGVSEAAKKLNLGQPALSSQLKTFEKKLKYKLFERDGRRLKLTEAGRGVYVKASQMFELAREIERLPKPGHLSSRVRIRVGVSTEIERPFCVEFVKNIIAQFDSSKKPFISLLSDRTGALVDKLQNGEIDAFITNTSVLREGVAVTSVINLPVGLVIHPKLLQNQKKSKHRSPHELVDLIEHLQVGFAVPASGLRLRDELDDFFRRVSYEPTINFESDTLAAVVRAVRDKLGVCMLPKSYVESELRTKALDFISPAAGYWRHHIYLVTKAKGQSSEKTHFIARAFKKLDV